MGTTPIKLNNATDTWVYEYTPTTAKGTTGSLLYVSGTAAKRCQSLLYFSLPFPRGVTVISAKLRLVQYGSVTGTSMPLTVNLAGSAWSATKATWNNKPAATGSTVTVTKTNPPAATLWEWDVTALLQTVSSGGNWYGFVIASAFNARLRFYSPQATVLGYRPVLEVSWKENPQKPTQLYPSNGRAVGITKPVLRTNFIDLSGDTTMAGIQVRLWNAANEALASSNTAADWDSGPIGASVPELDLNALAQPSTAVTAYNTTTDTLSVASGALGLAVGDRVVFSGTTAPTPLVLGTTYYVKAVTVSATTDFTVAATLGGAQIDITAAGTAVTVARPALAALTNGLNYFWRTRVQDGSGLWSDWSDYTSFAYQSKGVLTITNPTGGTVSDPSLPITWTFTGRTQKAYQVIVQNMTNSSGAITYDSGKITSTATAATVPASAMKYDNATYKITVRIWDTIDREMTSGDPVYVEASVTVTYVYSATVAAATGFTVTVDNTYGTVALNWSRATLPDNWTIYRDGKIVWTDEGADLFVSGTAYTWTDRLADPRVLHTWKVVSVVNGVGSASSPTATGTINLITTRLSATDGTNPVLIFDPNVDAGLDETSGVFQPAGSAPPVLITQSEHGYQGHISGRLFADPMSGLTAAQWRDRFNQLKKNNGNKLLLAFLDVSIECFIAKATVLARPLGPGNIVYVVEFDFYQTDWEDVP